MSAAETEVSEAIVESETEESSFDMDSAVESLAQDIFGVKPEEKSEDVKDNSETDEEVVEEGSEETEAEAEEPVETEEEVEKKSIPQSWKKDMQDRWDGLDTETQDYIELREKQMKEGIEVKKDDAELGMRMRDAFTPFDSVLKKQNIDPVTASQKLMATHMRMVSAPMEERKQLFNQLAQSYGITNEPADEETQKIMNNPMVQNLINKVNQLEQNVSATYAESKQEKEGRINTEVEAFASKHPYFDDLSDNIAKYIRGGESLEEAYNTAYRASPFFEKDLEKEREKKEVESEKQKKKDAEKAKKAKSVNVRGRDTSKAPTAPIGTMDDTMREVMRDIKNRN